jgi:hypothetical protein
LCNKESLSEEVRSEQTPEWYTGVTHAKIYSSDVQTEKKQEQWPDEGARLRRRGIKRTV